MQHDKFFASQSHSTFSFELKKKKQFLNYLGSLVFAAIIDYNDLIGKRGVLFLWERSSGIYFTK